jgi:hypothetical protein
MPGAAAADPAKPAAQGGGPARILGAISRFRVADLMLLLVVVLFAVQALQAPLRRFDRFAVFDSGGELAIQDLIRRGYRPSIDFGYLYGLLPLFLGRLWYGVAGLTTETYRTLVIACMVFSIWGLARFAIYRRIGLAGVMLIASAIPDLLLVTYIGFVQTLEQTLLVNALAEQSRGRRGAALVLLTVCCFVKPSLAVVQGLVVAIAIVAGCRGAGGAAWARQFGPALIAAVVLAIVLGASFGFVPLSRTILPMTAMEVYRLGGFGFFRGIGRDFWLIPGGGLREYFRYELGFWVLGTLFLIWGGLVGLWRLAKGRSSVDHALDDELCATCAAVHLGFVVLIFGHRGTWFYSLPMLILGLAIFAARAPWHRAAVWALVVLLLVSDRSKAVDLLRRWRTETRSPATLNLWADAQERSEWARALELARGEQPVLFAMCEGGALLIPGFAPPIGGYFVPGNALPAEVRRKADQLAAAPLIISAFPPDWPGFAFWPELEAALDGCELLMAGRYVWVYRRIAGNVSP